MPITALDVYTMNVLREAYFFANLISRKAASGELSHIAILAAHGLKARIHQLDIDRGGGIISSPPSPLPPAPIEPVEPPPPLSEKPIVIDDIPPETGGIDPVPVEVDKVLTAAEELKAAAAAMAKKSPTN